VLESPAPHPKDVLGRAAASYHTFRVFKWKEIGIPYPLESVDSPAKEQVNRSKSCWE
jgi:hypothetical protein